MMEADIPGCSLGEESMRKSVVNLVRYVLAFILAVNFLGSAFISLINPESYFFGAKLGGMEAALYLLGDSGVGVVIAYSLVKGHGKWLALLYFAYNFSEVLITNFSFGLGYRASPLFTAGLMLSIALLLLEAL